MPQWLTLLDMWCIAVDTKDGMASIGDIAAGLKIAFWPIFPEGTKGLPA